MIVSAYQDDTGKWEIYVQTWDADNTLTPQEASKLFHDLGVVLAQIKKRDSREEVEAAWQGVKHGSGVDQDAGEDE